MVGSLCVPVGVRETCWLALSLFLFSSGLDAEMASLTQPTQRRGKSVHQVNGVGQAEVVDVDDPYGPLRDGERAIAYRDKDEIAMGTGVGLYGLPTTKVLAVPARNKLDESFR